MIDISKYKYKIIELSDNLQIKVLHPKDVTDRYVQWLNNYEIVKYTEQKFFEHKKEDVIDFVKSKLNSNIDLLFGIYFKNNHIGNIKLGPIILNSNISDISFLIGEKEYWGFGLATKVVGAVVDFAFQEIKLAKVTAGCYANNLASIRVLEKNNFFKEGRRLSHLLYEGERIDSILFGRFN